MKQWIESERRYFESVDDYIERIVERAEKRHISGGFINRCISVKESDTICPFTSKRLCYEKGSSKTNRELYTEYLKFCKENDLVPLSKTSFIGSLKTYIFIWNNIPGILYSEPVYIKSEKTKQAKYYNLGFKGE